MIKKIEITDIHPKDMYYKNKDSIVGSVIDIDPDDIMDEIIKGWTTIKGNKDLMVMDKKNLSGQAFYGIKYKEIE